MWEYKRTEIKYKTINELNDKLNQIGSDGWEIIYYKEAQDPNTATVKLLLKRTKNE